MSDTAVARHLDDVRYKIDRASNHEVTILPIHILAPEPELNEVVPVNQHESSEENSHLQKDEPESHREYESTEVITDDQGRATTVTTIIISDETPPNQQPSHEEHAQPELRYEPPPASAAQAQTASGPKKTKRAHFALPKFGRGGREENLGPDTILESPRRPADSVTVQCYPRYLLRPIGILRIVQLVFGIIVCSAMNAEQCFHFSRTICVPPSSRTWGDDLRGIGYVLFVGVFFIIGNFALIFHHLLVKPVSSSSNNVPSTERCRFPPNDRVTLVEIIYDGTAIILYIIAASVAAWYASWYYYPNHSINPYRPQWITATIFAWINAGFYAITLAYRIRFA